MNMDFTRFENPSNVELVTRLMEPLKPLVPGWVSHLVFFRGEAEGNVACVTIDMAYRTVKIYLGDSFFLQREEEQVSILRHELAHIYTVPALQIFREQVLPLIDLPEAAKEAFNRIVANVMEGCTEDLQVTFERLMTGRKLFIFDPGKVPESGIK